MKTLSEVERWCQTAAERFGDPSLPVCQVFLRHVAHSLLTQADDLVFTVGSAGDLLLRLEADDYIPVGISPAGPEVDANSELVAFGIEQIESGLWVLQPSLNIPGLIHAFITLYGVPEPAPWAKLIVLAS